MTVPKEYQFDNCQYSDAEFNIIVTNDGIKLAERLVKKQCKDLMDKEIWPPTRAVFSIIMIGKQNNNHPLLIYLVDAYNRYCIMKRKKLIKRYGGHDYGANDTTEFKSKWNDPQPSKFINHKCKGFDALFGKDYTKSQIFQFKERCHHAITEFHHGLLRRPPMMPQHLPSIIQDDIIQISWYILNAYDTIHRFCSGGNISNVPCQIDLVILPRSFRQVQIASNKSDLNISDDDEDCDIIEEDEELIGSIHCRLEGHNNVVESTITPRVPYHRFMWAMTYVLEGKNHQRAILIVDRRLYPPRVSWPYSSDMHCPLIGGIILRYSEIHIPNEIVNIIVLFSEFLMGEKMRMHKIKMMKEDTFYCYGPDKSRKCTAIHKNPSTFLSESLFQNSRTCVLPKYKNDRVDVKDIGIDRKVGDMLTLSFHCLSATEIRVYLSYCGWGTRFFIQDIKYYLPMIFEPNQMQKLIHVFERSSDRGFVYKYEKCKEICMDPKFEKFYTELVHGSSNGTSCH